MSEIKRERVYVIDLLRFIAAFGVLLYHFTYRSPEIDHMGGPLFLEISGWTRYTHLGVPLFFMVSGFIIFYSVEGKTAFQFAWSRFVRLYPAYWLCCTITFIVCHYLWRPHFTASVSDWLVNMTMLQEYFKVEHIDAPYWTLAEELRFYGVTFGLMLIGQVHRRLTFVAVWMTLCAIDYWIKIPLAHYEMLLQFAPMFAGGIVYYDMFKDGVKRVHAPLLLATIVLGLMRFLRWSAHDGETMGAVCSAWVIVPVWLSIYAVFFLIATRRLVIQKQSSWLMALGGMTYPLYLIHNRIGNTLLISYAGHVNKWVSLFLIILGCAAIAFGIWRFVEAPAMRALTRLGKCFGF